MATVKQLINKQKTLIKEFNNLISERQGYFMSKSEKWQESVTGEDYSLTTNMIDMFVQELEAQLSEAGFI